MPLLPRPESALGAPERIDNKNQPDGYAGLDGEGLLHSNQIPQATETEMGGVMLARSEDIVTPTTEHTRAMTARSTSEMINAMVVNNELPVGGFKTIRVGGTVMDWSENDELQIVAGTNVNLIPTGSPSNVLVINSTASGGGGGGAGTDTNFLGLFPSLTALQSAYPNGEAGQYARVQNDYYTWDATTGAWIVDEAINVGVESVNGVLPDAAGNVNVNAEDLGAEMKANKGLAGGYSPLDLGARVPIQRTQNMFYWTDFTIDSVAADGLSFVIAADEDTVLGTLAIGDVLLIDEDPYKILTIGEDTTDATKTLVTVKVALQGTEGPGGVEQNVDEKLVATGMLTYFGGDTAPDGYMVADGSEVSRTVYPELFAVIGTKFGAGDGTTTYALPDLSTSTTATLGMLPCIKY